MKLSEFVDLIEAREFMAKSQIASIRRQMTAGKLEMTIDELARFLVDRRRLTKYQAKKLLAEMKTGTRASSIPMSSARRRAQNSRLNPFSTTEEGAEVGPDNLDLFQDQGEPADPFEADLLDLSKFGPLEAAADPLAATQHQKVKQRKNPWDSPLLLLGGGGLVVLLLVGGLLYFWLAFDSGDELFQAAEKSYRNGSYVQAAAEYDKFLRRFPAHPRAPLAEVRLGMAALWRSVESSTDWEMSLKTALGVLPEINQSPAFGEARPELASLLPEIAAGLGEQADQAQTLPEKERLVELAATALQLVNDPNYLPTSLRQGQQRRIEAIENNLARSRRDIDRDRDLGKTLVQIQAQSAAGDFQAVYQLRRELVERYPALRREPSLTEAVSAAAVKLVDQVQPIPRFPKPQTDDPRETQSINQLVMVQRSSTLPIDPTGDVAIFRLYGAAYGLDLASGGLLWRRYVGLGPDAWPVSWKKADDAARTALVDTSANELLLLDGQTGKLLWRHAFKSRPYRPLRDEDALLVVEEAGRVWKFDAESGQVQAAVVLPQPVVAPLGMLAGVPSLYAIAEHSNLFVLSPDDLACREVVPVGHEVGTIQIPPTGTLRHLFLYENAGLEYSFLHVLAVDAEGINARRTQEAVRLEGQVLVPPVVADARLITTNDRGEVWVHEVNLAAKQTPARLVAATKSDNRQPIVSYPLIDHGTLWTGDRRLTRYVMQLSRGSVVRKLVAHDGDTFIAPLQLHGDLLVQARRQSDAGGYVVEAQRIGPNQLEDVWRTTLGTPTAGDAFTLKGLPRPLVVTSRGSVFTLPATNQEAFQVLDQPQAQIGSATRRFRFDASAPVGDARRLVFPPEGETGSLLIEAVQGKAAAHLVEWELPASARACVPAVWNGLVLVPTKLGQVVPLNPFSGAAEVHPFQPELAFGEAIDWATPVPMAGMPPSVILSDRQFRLFRLGLADEPEPHLVELNKVTLSQPLRGPLAVAGLMLVGAGQQEGRDVLHLFQLPELALQDPIPLTGELIRPPRAVDGTIYCATTREGLLAIGDDFQVAWTLGIEGKTPVAGPVVFDGHLAVAFAEGEVWLIDAASGKRLARRDVDEPLADNLSSIDGQLWAHGPDGTLHRVSWEETNP